MEKEEGDMKGDTRTMAGYSKQEIEIAFQTVTSPGSGTCHTPSPVLLLIRGKKARKGCQREVRGRNKKRREKRR